MLLRVKPQAMNSKTLFKKLIDYPYEQTKDLKTLFALLRPEYHAQTIEYLNFMNHEICGRIENTITALKRQNKYHMCIHAINAIETPIYEICNIEYGEEQQSGEGLYPACGSGLETSSTWNREGSNILIGNFRNSWCCINFTSQKVFLGSNAFSINAKPQKVLQEFLVLYLHEHIDCIFDCTRNCKDLIDMEKYNDIKVKIPDMEKQKEILQLVKKNNELVKVLSQQLSENGKEVQNFISETTTRLLHKSID